MNAMSDRESDRKRCYYFSSFNWLNAGLMGNWGQLLYALLLRNEMSNFWAWINARPNCKHDLYRYLFHYFTRQFWSF